MPKPRLSQMTYDLILRPMRGKPVKTDEKIELPLPSIYTRDGKAYYFVVADQVDCYAVYAEERPT